jgi:hypothetical protein
MSPYKLWLSEIDEEGNALDPDILKAARELEPTSFRYRQKEIGCESLTNTIAQAGRRSGIESNTRPPSGKPQGVPAVRIHPKNE